ncbi:MAG TPA: peptidoglycan -binding protein [Thermohalobaculum sp.]|nr:peptidoglycan -binding protein [Thermohalobaculum sp.]
MAFSRRAGGRPEANTWPGFVDALTALLLILMFVLSIFMIVQFTMHETISGQSRELDELNRQLSGLANELSLERDRAETLEGEVGGLRATLAEERRETDRLNAALAAMARAHGAAQARAADLEDRLAESVSEREALEAAVASARRETDAAQEAARLAAARREALEAMVAELESKDRQRAEEMAQVSAERARALALLDELRSEKAEAESEAERLARERASLMALVEEMRLDQDRIDAEMARLETENVSLAEQRRELEALRAAAARQLDETQARLSAEEEARLAEVAAAEALRRRLEESDAELDAMTLALEEARKEAEETLTLLAAARAAQQELAGRLDERAEEVDREEALRRLAESELSRAKQQTLEEQRRVALLNAQLRELREQLGSLQALLEDYEARDTESQVQIAELGERLNRALAQRVGELARYQSVFFQKMDEVLGGRDDIQRVGDRFVFQSEVLFAPGSAELGPEGEAELAKLGEVMWAISGEVPDDLDWILRVDGHTDKRPITRGGRYRDNWELSQARALSVVRYLIDVEGVPPERLAAAGFGEHQPIAEGDLDEELARNRRIEFKFTER